MQLSRTVFLLATLTAAPRLATAQTELYTKDGAGGEAFGHSVAVMSDITGDGAAEIVVGAPWADGDNGRTYVLSGIDGSVVHTFFGFAWPDRFGESVSGAGDVDGDGVEDVVSGGIRKAGLFLQAGYARVDSGAGTGPIYTFEGSPGFAGDNFGIAVSSAGDVDADGRADVLVGATEAWAGKEGQAYVYSGMTGGELFRVRGLDGFDRLGRAVAGAGDVDCDGHSDLLIGAPELFPGSVGYVVVVSGKAALDLGVPVVDLADPAHVGAVLTFAIGQVDEERFGESVGVVGDVNGDGVADLIAGSPYEDTFGVQAGKVTVFSGADGAVLRSDTSTTAYDQLGVSVAGIGDFDADGVPDYAAGSKQTSGWELIDPAFPYGPGTVRVYNGVDGSVAGTISGPAIGSNLGFALAAGDVNGNGSTDLAIGLPLASMMDGAVGLYSPLDAVSTYGGGCPGSGGFQPTLAISCGLVPGSPLEVEVNVGMGGATALVLMGSAPGSFAMPLGCDVLVSPLPTAPSAVLALAGSAPGEGTAAVQAKLPAGSSGATLAFQALVLDPGAAGMYASTNGCLLTLP